ncbi:MAG: ankyrin-3-like [Rickettsiales bacterium]|jgi:hypothetical protein|nr:ankyrin-3-like [Rickettsiales bacterium]
MAELYELINVITDTKITEQERLLKVQAMLQESPELLVERERPHGPQDDPYPSVLGYAVGCGHLDTARYLVGCYSNKGGLFDRLAYNIWGQYSLTEALKENGANLFLLAVVSGDLDTFRYVTELYQKNGLLTEVLKKRAAGFVSEAIDCKDPDILYEVVELIRENKFLNKELLGCDKEFLGRAEALSSIASTGDLKKLVYMMGVYQEIGSLTEALTAYGTIELCLPITDGMSFFSNTGRRTYMQHHPRSDHVVVQNAVINGHLEVVCLLEKVYEQMGLDFTEALKAGDHGALRNAAGKGNLEMVRHLVGVYKEKGLDFTEALKAGYHGILSYAAGSGNLEMVRYLEGLYEEKGLDFTKALKANYHGALRNAAGKGNLEMVRYLEGLYKEKGLDFKEALKADDHYALREAARIMERRYSRLEKHRHYNTCVLLVALAIEAGFNDQELNTMLDTLDGRSKEDIFGTENNSDIKVYIKAQKREILELADFRLANPRTLRTAEAFTKLTPDERENIAILTAVGTKQDPVLPAELLKQIAAKASGLDLENQPALLKELRISGTENLYSPSETFGTIKKWGKIWEILGEARKTREALHKERAKEQVKEQLPSDKVSSVVEIDPSINKGPNSGTKKTENIGWRSKEKERVRESKQKRDNPTPDFS